MAGTFASIAARLLDAASEPTRLRILELLGVRPHNVSELCSAMGIRQQAASHHLGRLLLNGLVARDRRGRSNYYALTPGGERLLGAAYASVA